MKVLWICNTLFPDVCAILKRPTPFTGGWMYSSATALLNSQKNIQLAVAALYGGKELKIFKINNITYYCLPFKENQTKYNSLIEPCWKLIKADFAPDIVHIHGTEFAHGLAYIKACGVENCIASIQGLVSVYARYSLGGISYKNIIKNITFYDMLRGGMLHMSKKMEQQGLLEKEYIKLLNHIIGRTDWDRSHAQAINPKINYHFCNETLRDEFYQHTWDSLKCEVHSIFLSQAYKPIKGIHILVKALPLILQRFPNTKVYVGGHNFLAKKTLKENLKYDGYAKYVKHLMDKNDVFSKFNFLGTLGEKQICECYLNANVFICPSSIENSPNSIGEAQLLGVPCIASFVGGTPNMIDNGITGLLYRFEEYEMLAEAVCRIFSDSELSMKLSTNSQIEAIQRHNKITNANRLLEIYNSI